MMRDFKVNFTEKEVSSVYQKIKDYPWDTMPELDGWEHGTNKKYLKELCDYWVSEFDWHKHEKLIKGTTTGKMNYHTNDRKTFTNLQTYL